MDRTDRVNQPPPPATILPGGFRVTVATEPWYGLTFFYLRTTALAHKCFLRFPSFCSDFLSIPSLTSCVCLDFGYHCM